MTETSSMSNPPCPDDADAFDAGKGLYGWRLEDLSVEQRRLYQCTCFARFTISMGYGARAPKPTNPKELPPTWQEVGRNMFGRDFSTALQRESAMLQARGGKLSEHR